MQIKRIKVGGFKNIDDVELELSDITSLISINSYGKSNVLKAIQEGLDFINCSINDRIYKVASVNNIPFNHKNFYKNFYFEIEAELSHSDIAESLIYGYEFCWSNNNENVKGKIKKEYLKIKEIGSQKYSSYISRDNNEAVYKPSRNSRCIKRVNIDDLELVLNKLTAYDGLFFLSIVKEISTLNIFIDRNFDTNKKYDFDTYLTTRIKGGNTSDSIPELLYKLKIQRSDKYEMIVNTIIDIFPFIERIVVDEVDIGLEGSFEKNLSKICMLLVEDKHNKSAIYFENMSDGVRRVLVVFLSLVMAEINNIPLVAIEEPENSLNPRILQRYLIALKAFSKNTKIIITSHSPYLINYLSPKNILIGVPNQYGLVDFAKIRVVMINRLLSDASNMDMLVGDYLFDLMSGDEEDMRKLLSYVS